MSEQELWSYFLDKKVASSHPFDRDFVWIRREDFEPIKTYFIKEINLMHHGQSFRSKAYFSHIHAVDQGEFIFVHPDTGNLVRFLPLGLLHLVVDVIPYFAFALMKRKSFKELFAYPN